MDARRSDTAGLVDASWPGVTRPDGYTNRPLHCLLPAKVDHNVACQGIKEAGIRPLGFESMALPRPRLID